MKVTWLWHGGRNYTVPYPDEGETFESMKAARAEFYDRAHNPYYPCCYPDTEENGGPSAWVFYGTEVGDCPDKIMSFGPRGGVKVENC